MNFTANDEGKDVPKTGKKGFSPPPQPEKKPTPPPLPPPAPKK